MPDVLLASKNDWANIGYVFEQSLKTIGVDAVAMTENLHGFHYTHQAKQSTPSEMIAVGKESKVVVNMHSVKTVPHDDRRHFGVFHGGSQYRMAPAPHNLLFNPHISFSLIQTDDLLNCGAKNEQWVLPAIDLEVFQPRFGILRDKIQIAHHPRSAPEKGAPAVNRVMKGLASDGKLGPLFDYTFESKHIPWVDNIERLAACDIYVEILAPLHNGKRHGVWGVTALEAAALGKIVVTNFNGYKRYLKEYGPCALQVANTEEELKRTITRLLSLSTDELESMQVASREWVEKLHSYKATGERLKRIIDAYCSDSSPRPGWDAGPFIYRPKVWWEVNGTKVKLPLDVLGHETSYVMEHINKYGLRDGSFLEVGQGIGQTRQYMKNRGLVLNDYQAVDFVQGTRHKFKELHGILPGHWDGKTLKYESETFATVLCLDVLHYVASSEIEQVVGELFRVTKDYVIISAYLGGNSSMPDFCSVHDYAALWKQNGAEIMSERATGNGTRMVWLLKKPATGDDNKIAEITPPVTRKSRNKDSKEAKGNDVFLRPKRTRQAGLA